MLDTGGRGATTTFVQHGLGDVLLTFENEVSLASAELKTQGKAGGFVTVVPSISVLAEMPVAVVEKVTAYAQFLFSDEGQTIGVRHALRPTSTTVRARTASQFPALELVPVARLGDWAALQRKHFSEGGVFDQIYGEAAR